MRTSKGPLWCVVVAAVLLGIAVSMLAFVEVLFGWPVRRATFLVFAAAGTVVAALPILSGRRRPGTVVYAAFLVALVVLHVVPWSTRKPFVHDLDRIEDGMTVDEVEAIMGKYMKGTGWHIPDAPAPPVRGPGDPEPDASAYGDPETWPEVRLEGAIVYRHSDEAAFNSDWGIVRFRDGRVVSTEFSPD